MYKTYETKHKKEEDAKNYKLSLLISKREAELFEEILAKKRMKKSEVLRKLVQDYIKENENFLFEEEQDLFKDVEEKERIKNLIR